MIPRALRFFVTIAMLAVMGVAGQSVGAPPEIEMLLNERPTMMDLASVRIQHKLEKAVEEIGGAIVGPNRIPQDAVRSCSVNMIYNSNTEKIEIAISVTYDGYTTRDRAKELILAVQDRAYIMETPFAHAQTGGDYNLAIINSRILTFVTFSCAVYYSPAPYQSGVVSAHWQVRGEPLVFDN